MSQRRVVSGGDVRVVVQQEVSSGPSVFAEFGDKSTFVDKSLAIEAFLRNGRSHHLVLRPRRSGKTYTLSMIREFLERPLKHGASKSTGDITTSMFAGTAITDHSELVSEYFRQYPVLYIDLKDVHGATYEEMLKAFDSVVYEIIGSLRKPYSDFVDDSFCMELLGPGALEPRRSHALKIITRELQRVYQKDVVVLIDEYDTPMHSAIELGYAALANNFFDSVFSSLLKGNRAVHASMMVGICRIVKSSWVSSLNNIEIFPMHAEDDRYAKFFLFTEKEIEILCDNHTQLSVKLLLAPYNGYAATCGSGLVKLYNPFSVINALEANKISNFWVETGRYSPLSQNLWCAGPGFRDNLDLLLTRKSVQLVIDEHTNYLSYDAISDSGLWGLLYYTGYLTIESVLDRPSSLYIFRIPNGEVTTEWHGWVRNYLVANRVTSLSSVYDTIVGGGAVGFQKQFTAFLQEYFALFCAPHHKEKVYQAMCYMLIALFGQEYDVRMEQDAGHGRSDITAHPFSAQRLLALILEIKSVPHYLKRNGKQSLKTVEQMRKDLEKAKIEALGQLADRRYRERVPCHATKVHEFAFVFCGNFCVAAVRTLQRNSTEDWEEVAADSTVVSESMTDMDDEDVGDEGEEA